MGGRGGGGKGGRGNKPPTKEDLDRELEKIRGIEKPSQDKIKEQLDAELDSFKSVEQ